MAKLKIARKCENCGNKLEPGIPRKRNGDGDLLCPACASDRPGGGRAHAMCQGGGLGVHAHIPVDESVISHCPMCGSAKITQRSDDLIACEMCGQSFIVKSQPSPAFARQDGVVDNQVPPGDQTLDQHLDQALQDPDADPDETEENPFAKKNGSDEKTDDDKDLPSFMTASGASLDEDAYLEYLAAQHGLKGKQ